MSATSDLNSIDVTPLPENKNGMSDIYANNDAHRYQFFQPLTIAGYPAADAESADDRSTGTCAIVVGVTDQLAVLLLTQIGAGVNKTNPCPIAEKVGAAMIEHLKGTA
jgi:hypothetical protein